MELRQIKDLMAAMRRHNMHKLVFEKDGVKLELEQESSGAVAPVALPAGATHAAAALPAAPQTSFVRTPEPAPAASAPEPVEDNNSYVTSPIVGTYYASPSPDDDAFVKVGDSVKKGDVVCIVEAMKVMNEVKADVSGTVKEVLIENGHPVEFGTKLFAIAPKG